MSTSEPTSRTTRRRSVERPASWVTALAATLVSGVVTAGCAVTAGNPELDAARATTEEVLAGGVEIDTAAPPSRGDLAMAEGRRFDVLQPRDMEDTFEVTVRFRDGHVVQTPAHVLGVEATSDEAPPTSVTASVHDLTPEDLRARLEEAVDELGADRADVESVLASARTATDGPADLIVTVPTAVARPDRLEIKVVVTALEGRTSVQYLAGWVSDVDR